MEPPAEVPHRVFLHVGAPKTGTTFIQEMLFHHRATIADHGVLYPADHYDEHFLAAVDLQRLAFNDERRPHADGHWDRVAFRARSWPGTSVISHDVFAAATPEQVARAVADLAPAEVHVVFTARDLARQLPSHWQEDVKHGEPAGFDAWLDACLAHDDSRWNRPWFWRVEDIPDVLRRWGSELPPEHVHLVTVPPADQPDRLLWDRFATVVGIDGLDLSLDVVGHTNSGLGRVEAGMVRRLNALGLPGMSQTEYEHVVKGVLAHEILPQSEGRDRLVLPAARLETARELAIDWIEAVDEAGYDVVGSLAELVPLRTETSAVVDGDGRGIDDVRPDELLGASMRSVRDLLLRIRDERAAAAPVHAERDDLARQVEELTWRVKVAEWAVEEHRNLTPWARIKRTIIEIGDTSRSVDRVLEVYRRVRKREARTPELPPGS